MSTELTPDPIKQKIDAYVHHQLEEQEIENLWAALLANPDYFEYLQIQVMLQHLITEEKDYMEDSQASENKSRLQRVDAYLKRWFGLA